MNGIRPRELYLLTEAHSDECAGGSGEWRFVLQETSGPFRLEVAELEPGVVGERLELLAVVRGLEAIDGTASVTVVTASRYVGHGIRFGLSQWRESGWQWEKFGEMTTISNLDLWHRVDQAMQFHQIDCRVWRLPSRMANEIAPMAVAPESRPLPTNRVSRWLRMPAAVATCFHSGQWLPKSASMAAT